MTCLPPPCPELVEGTLPPHLSDHLCVPHHPRPGAKAGLPTSLWVTEGSAVSESSPAKTPEQGGPVATGLEAGPVLDHADASRKWG